MKYQKFFYVIYIICFIATVLPIGVQPANKAILVGGWPLFFVWLMVWALIGVAAMLINYRLDCKADAERKQKKQ